MSKPKEWIAERILNYKYRKVDNFLTKKLEATHTHEIEKQQNFRVGKAFY